MKLKLKRTVSLLFLSEKSVKDLENFVFSQNYEKLSLYDSWDSIVLENVEKLKSVYDVNFYKYNNKFLVSLYPIENNSANYSKFLTFHVV